MHDPREIDDHATLINLDLFKVFDRVDHFLAAALSVTSFQHGFSFLDMPIYAPPQSCCGSEVFHVVQIYVSKLSTFTHDVCMDLSSQKELVSCCQERHYIIY